MEDTDWDKYGTGNHPKCAQCIAHRHEAWGMLHIAYRTREPAGRLIVVGIAMMFTYQVFENIGMTIGLSPCTGLTLPFVSYGGSSLLANFMALAMVMNVAMHPSRDLA